MADGRAGRLARVSVRARAAITGVELRLVGGVERVPEGRSTHPRQESAAPFRDGGRVVEDPRRTTPPRRAHRRARHGAVHPVPGLAAGMAGTASAGPGRCRPG
ncbi:MULTISPECIES: hypothetical protein, partial [unclassified Streptomyces]|uniref:hypothetical protein n=1 Tax=unclassified Streptomyces TaxID=2593676 RepID=UPI00081B355C